jgi:AraC-like DNA-binding protein
LVCAIEAVADQPFSNQLCARYFLRCSSSSTRVQRSLSTRVRAALVDAMPNGNPSEEDIAEAVRTSPRTLQRRLAEQGASFSRLLDDVRRELAEKYIVDQAMTLGEVSYLLGFSEVSAFSRAFSGWTGEAPTRYRKRAA